MKIQEAIENLKYLISGDCTEDQMDFVEEIEMAIDALKKQIPKKYLLVDGECICPACKANKRSLDYYCDNCGQAIDWSDM